MRTSLHACGFYLLLGAGLVSGAEPAAPLESTKQELRQLEQDRKNRVGQGPAAPAGVETPAVQLQVPGTDSPQHWLNEKLKRERKQKEEKEQKNWLVDGVQKLGQEEAAQRDPASVTKAGESTEPRTGAVDTSDPQYLLKLFDEQKGNGAKEAKPLAGKAHAATPDAFAPFLQEWLGSSPVRGQLLDQFVKPADASVAIAAAPAGGGEFRPGNSGAVVATGSRDSVPKANPYLVELETPVLKGPPGGESAPLAAPPATLAPDLNRPSAGPAALEPLPEVRPAAKGPPPGVAEDRKYFPQLKKF